MIISGTREPDTTSPAAGPPAHRYRRHQPENTVLYPIVEEHLPALTDELANHHATLPGFVVNEFRDYLRCGRLEHGFIRVKCNGCRHEHLVAFSCKRRGFCPSCGTRRMIETVRSQLGLPLRIGLAPTKLVARLAAEESGPSALRVVPADEAAAFLAPLSVGRLTRVGRKTEATLAALGAARVGDLLSLDPVRLEAALGNRGLAILELARGNDDSRVRVARHPRSISRERKLAGAAPDDGRGMSDALRQLANALSANLERQGLRARRVALKLRFVDQTTLTRSATLGEPVLEAADIYGTAQSLLGRVEAGRDTIHTVGVVLAGLISAGQEERQLELF
jgi:ribosomal protein S27E